MLSEFPHAGVAAARLRHGGRKKLSPKPKTNPALRAGITNNPGKADKSEGGGRAWGGLGWSFGLFRGRPRSTWV